MPDDQNTSQNPIHEENPLPTSLQESTGQTPEITPVAEPLNMSPEAPESSKNVDIPVSLNNANSENSPISIPNAEEVKPEELPAEGGKTEEIVEPIKSSEDITAQIPVNEPLSKVSLARELLAKARNAIQFRKRKKLDKIMSLFLKKSQISNKDVGEFLHVSDATATRYLDILEKENKIKQTGKTGHAVGYTRI